jgi:hypothetical protein
MNVPEPRREPAPDTDEAGSLAAELARAYEQMTVFYRDQLGLADGDADRHARGLDLSPHEAHEDAARIRARPPDQVSWFDLNRLAARDPQDAAAVWKEIKTEAGRELASGHRTAQALSWQGRPWDRARFLAIRDSVQSGSPPQGGVEAALLDMAAAAFADYLEWSEQLQMQSSGEVELERDSVRRDGRWSPARLSMAAAIEQSARMTERAHQRFLRTVKMLHELQRTAPTLYVAQAEQINVGTQQVNQFQASRTTLSPVADPPNGPLVNVAHRLDDFDKSK